MGEDHNGSRLSGVFHVKNLNVLRVLCYEF